MLPKSGLRLIGRHALLVALMVQGLTPSTDTLVSPWTLRWLDSWAAAGQPDARDGRIPDPHRPAPSNPNDQDEAPDEVGIPGDFRTPAILSRWPAIPCGQPAWTNGRHQPPVLAQVHQPSATAADPISSLCRMTC